MQNPSNPLYWGAREWGVFHRKVLSYSHNPSYAEKEQMIQYFQVEFAQRIPCYSCKTHYQQFVSQFPPVLDSQYTLFNWSVDIHNKVNQKIGKQLVTYDQAKSIWYAQDLYQQPQQQQVQQQQVQQQQLQEQQVQQHLLQEQQRQYVQQQQRQQQYLQTQQQQYASQTINWQNHNQPQKVQPVISTAISTSVRPGSTISDNAVLRDGNNPTGTIIFKIYGPNDSACTGIPIHTSLPIPVKGNGSYSSGPITFQNDGVHTWTVDYSGDANNHSAKSQCGGH